MQPHEPMLDIVKPANFQRISSDNMRRIIHILKEIMRRKTQYVLRDQCLDIPYNSADKNIADKASFQDFRTYS